jgi:hypothetical protein
MAVVIMCDNPAQLLAEIKLGIRQGTVTSWVVDTDGDFTLADGQWSQRAWLRPTTAEGRLILKIIGPQSQRMSKATYAVYHSRFIETLLRDFDLKFSQAWATALATPGEYVGQPAPVKAAP